MYSSDPDSACTSNAWLDRRGYQLLPSVQFVRLPTTSFPFLQRRHSKPAIPVVELLYRVTYKARVTLLPVLLQLYIVYCILYTVYCILYTVVMRALYVTLYKSSTTGIAGLECRRCRNGELVFGAVLYSVCSS